MALTLLDIAPISAATTGILAVAVVFFFATTAVAYIAFRLFKRTFKSAVRMAFVAAVLIIALVGGVSIYYFGSRSTPPSKPPVSRTR